MEKPWLRSVADSADMLYVTDGRVTRISVPRGHRIEVDASTSRETGGVAGGGAPQLRVVLLVTPIAGVEPPEISLSTAVGHEASAAATAPEQMMDLLEAAWGVIANSGVFGNPQEPSPGCREAAVRWRDQYHETLSAWCRRQAPATPGS